VSNCLTWAKLEAEFRCVCPVPGQQFRKVVGRVALSSRRQNFWASDEINHWFCRHSPLSQATLHPAPSFSPFLTGRLRKNSVPNGTPPSCATTHWRTTGPKADRPARPDSSLEPVPSLSFAPAAFAGCAARHTR
jgi:hypothetical protein